MAVRFVNVGFERNLGVEEEIMIFNQFLKKVQEYAGIEKPEVASKVIQATLETLSERIPRTHRQHLAAQLPEEMKSFLPKNTHMEYFRLEEFYQRMGNRANISYHNAVRYGEAVARVLREAVGSGELKDILSALPDEYQELFGAKPAGPLSPSSV
jgi:uncharacterized protein (DUF2267 family)